MIIRAERDRELNYIREINIMAFGREKEADLVNRIRRSGYFLSSLSLVAAGNGKPSGHILFSIISVDQQVRLLPALSLASVAVLPGCQGKGIGGALIRKGLKKSASAG